MANCLATGPHDGDRQEDHVKGKRDRKVTNTVQVQDVPKDLVKQESRAVLAIRIPFQTRDRLRAAAGWGKQQEFVYSAIMTAIEKAERK
jgi:hypothetical protein